MSNQQSTRLIDSWHDRNRLLSVLCKPYLYPPYMMRIWTCRKGAIRNSHLHDVCVADVIVYISY